MRDDLTRPGDARARLSKTAKAVFALGDLTTNASLASLSLIYATYFLIEIAEVRPVLAGLIPLIGRTVDAVTDPLMGRISDATRSRWGRRRPYLLAGALPFGITYAMLWVAVPLESESARFAYYVASYCLASLATTVLTVPYLALQPEMASDYDERTSLNTFRTAGGILGIIVAVGLRPLAELFGGGPAGFSAAGAAMGAMLAAPWFAVHRVTFERPEFSLRPAEIGLVEGLRRCFRHAAFVRLTVLYLCGRVAMDLMGAMLVVYFTYWVGRTGDFEIMMLVFMPTVVLTLPVWMRVAPHMEKSTAFVIGSLWWIAGLMVLLLAQPDWPRWLIMVLAPPMALGFGVVDLMPWSMVGDVVDEDDLATGERREGVYHGVFAFLRKLAGAIAVAGALGVLDLLGYRPGAEQNQTVLWAIRLLASVVPAAFLALGVAFSLGYPLTRREHGRILAELSARDAAV